MRDPRIDPRAGDVLRDVDGLTIRVVAYEFWNNTIWRVRWTIDDLVSKAEFAGGIEGFRKAHRYATVLHAAEEPAHAG